MKKIQQIICKIWRKAKHYILSFVSGQFKERQKRYKLIPMRELSQSEKYVVKKLVQWDFYLRKNPHDWYNESLASLFSRFAYKHKAGFIIDNKNSKVFFKVSSINLPKLLAVTNSFRRDFITITHFINYLHKENLLFVAPLHKNAGTIPYEKDWTEKNFGYKSEEVHIEDKEFVDLLLKYYDKALIPTEYLVKYYEQDFKTDEEVRFDKNISKVNESIKVAKKSLKAAWNGVYVAIFIGLISICIGLYGVLKPSNDTELILDRIDKFEEKTNIRFNKLEKNDIKQDLRLDKIEKQVNVIINKESNEE